MSKSKELIRELPVDYDRVVKYDEDGNEFVVFEPVDYAKIRASIGKVKNWTLNSLLKAGINPNFGIHTGMPTRLEGFSELGKFETVADQILAEANSSSDEK